MRVGGFVGRLDQLATLDGALRAAWAGEPAVVVVGGDPGIGKTRLIEHAATRAEEGDALVLRAACVELGAEGLPLAPLTAALRALVRRFGPDGVAALVPGADELLLLLPEAGPPGPRDPGSGAARGTQARLFELFGALLRRLAARDRVLLVIDDLHWADRSSRELFALLTRTLREGRIAILAAYRTDQLDRRHPLPGLVAELDRLGWVHRIDLGPLARAETADLVAELLGGPAPAGQADRIHRRAAGVPLFVEELTRAADPDILPGSLRDLLLHPIESLPPAAEQLVRSAAVAGPHVPHDLLAELASLPEDDLLAAVRAAADARILVPREDGYAFRHELLREAVLGGLLPAERRRLHRRYARALATRPDLVPPDRLDAELAHHWYGAGDAGRARPALLRAADAAGRINAHAERAQLLERALHTWPDGAAAPPPGPDAVVPGPGGGRADPALGVDRLAVLEQAAVAATWAGEPLRALDLVDRALAEVDQGSEPGRAALLLAHRGMLLQDLPRDGAVTALDEAMRLVPAEPTVTRARVLDLVSAVQMLRGSPGAAHRAAREAADIAAGAGDTGLVANARTTEGWALTRLGRHAEGLRVLHAAGELARRDGDDLRLTRVLLNTAETLRDLGRYREAIGTAREGLAAAGAAGVGRALGALLTHHLAACLADTGRWDEADRLCASTLDDSLPDPAGIGLNCVAARIALARAEPELAAHRLDRARALLHGQPTPSRPPELCREEGELALWDHHITAACEAVRAGLAATATPQPPPDPAGGDDPDGAAGAAGGDDGPAGAAGGDDDPHGWGSAAGGRGPAALVWPLLATGARIVSRARLRARTMSIADECAGLVDVLRAAVRSAPVDTPLWRAYAIQVAAELDGPQGDWPAAVAAWQEVDRPYEAAWAGLRAAERAARAGDRDAAARFLLPATERADRLGAAALREEIRLFTRTARVLPTPAPEAGGRAAGLGLTGREWEVLRLVAEGRSNRQIGEQLYISTKTASVHVSNILAKLGAATRAEATATVHRLGLFSRPGADP